MKIMFPKDLAVEIKHQQGVVRAAMLTAHKSPDVTLGEKQIVMCLAMLHEATLMVLGQQLASPLSD